MLNIVQVEENGGINCERYGAKREAARFTNKETYGYIPWTNKNKSKKYFSHMTNHY